MSRQALLLVIMKLAERVGFEPTVEFPRHSLSRRALSTAQTPLRSFSSCSLTNVVRGHNSGCGGQVRAEKSAGEVSRMIVKGGRPKSLYQNSQFIPPAAEQFAENRF